MSKKAPMPKPALSSPFDTMPVRDRQTDRQTHDGSIYRAIA